MSQLYDLKRGGVGTREDACEEQYLIMMEYLTFPETIAFALMLAKIPNVFANEKNILEVVAEKLARTNGEQITIRDMQNMLKEIARIVRIKSNDGTTESRDKTTDLIDIFLEKARKHGYKDADRFFST